MSKQINHIYEFGEFRVESADRRLLRNGQPISLTPKVFETLLALVRSGGHVVEKDELMKLVWPDAFVEEANLARNVWALRKALDDDNGEHRYIETVSKRGYRFIAMVRESPSQSVDVVVQRRVRAHIAAIEEESSEPSAADTETTALTPTTKQLGQTSALIQARPVAKLRSHRGKIALIGIGCVLVGLGIAAAILRRNANRSPARTAIDSLAVMPFVNASGNPELEYLSDGITENIINRISLAPHLKMIAHNSVSI